MRFALMSLVLIGLGIFEVSFIASLFGFWYLPFLVPLTIGTAFLRTHTRWVGPSLVAATVLTAVEPHFFRHLFLVIPLLLVFAFLRLRRGVEESLTFLTRTEFAGIVSGGALIPSLTLSFPIHTFPHWLLFWGEGILIGVAAWLLSLFLIPHTPYAVLSRR